MARDILRVTESLNDAGLLLASLIMDKAYSSPGFFYFSNRLIGRGQHSFEAAQTSTEAADIDKAFKLWNLSEQLIQRALL